MLCSLSEQHTDHWKVGFFKIEHPLSSLVVHSYLQLSWWYSPNFYWHHILGEFFNILEATHTQSQASWQESPQKLILSVGCGVKNRHVSSPFCLSQSSYSVNSEVVNCEASSDLQDLLVILPSMEALLPHACLNHAAQGNTSSSRDTYSNDFCCLGTCFSVFNVFHNCVSCGHYKFQLWCQVNRNLICASTFAKISILSLFLIEFNFLLLTFYPLLWNYIIFIF
jgi:hypothetical protein